MRLLKTWQHGWILALGILEGAIPCRNKADWEGAEAERFGKGAGIRGKPRFHKEEGNSHLSWQDLGCPEHPGLYVHIHAKDRDG